MSTPLEFRPARLGGQRGFPVQSILLKAGETYKKGALVYVDTNGKLLTCGANPTLIKGVAINAAFSGPGNSLADSADVVAVMPADSSEPIGTGQVAVANDNTVFVGQMFSGSTLIVPTQNMIGGSYGVAAVSSVFAVDQTVSTGGNTRVAIVDIDTDLNLVFFKILSSYIQP